jgi:hypothetical protein
MAQFAGFFWVFVHLRDARQWVRLAATPGRRRLYYFLPDCQRLQQVLRDFQMSGKLRRHVPPHLRVGLRRHGCRCLALRPLRFEVMERRE